MKKVLVLLVLLVAITLSAKTIDVSSDFCDGWEEGYQEALEGCLKVGVTPVCPVPPVGKNTYKHGYGIGYAKAQKVCDE
jgi:hypothetical protein